MITMHNPFHSVSILKLLMLALLSHAPLLSAGAVDSGTQVESAKLKTEKNVTDLS